VGIVFSVIEQTAEQNNWLSPHLKIDLQEIRIIGKYLDNL
jgi:hypothetical protein